MKLIIFNTVPTYLKFNKISKASETWSSIINKVWILFRQIFQNMTYFVIFDFQWPRKVFFRKMNSRVSIWLRPKSKISQRYYWVSQPPGATVIWSPVFGYEILSSVTTWPHALFITAVVRSSLSSFKWHIQIFFEKNSQNTLLPINSMVELIVHYIQFK